MYAPRDFHSSLGYPGEGPLHAPHPSCCLTAFWLPSIAAFLLACFAASSCVAGPLSAPPSPLVDFAAPCLGACWGRPVRLCSHVSIHFLRAAERSAAEPLQEGRPTLPITGRLRDRYWTQFEQWLVVEGIDFESLLHHHVECIDDINAVMSRLGRALYNAGKPYNPVSYTHLTLPTKLEV